MREKERQEKESKLEPGKSTSEDNGNSFGSSAPIPPPYKPGEGPGINIVTMHKVGDEIITT